MYLNQKTYDFINFTFNRDSLSFQPQIYPQNGYGQYYANNLVNSANGVYNANDYMQQPALSAYATNEGYARSSDNLYSSSSGQPLGEVESRRYSVHVRNSPVSPPQSSSATISVKNYNSSFDYMPASAFVSSSAMLATSSPRESTSNGTLTHGSSLANYRHGSHLDNYSVYVNKPHAGLVPVHEVGNLVMSSATTSAGTLGKGSSLATHVWIHLNQQMFLTPSDFSLTRVRRFDQSISSGKETSHPLIELWFLRLVLLLKHRCDMFLFFSSLNHRDRKQEPLCTVEDNKNPWNWMCCPTTYYCYWLLL